MRAQGDGAAGAGSARPQPFCFGDAQNEIRTHRSRVFREAFRHAPRAAFTLAQRDGGPDRLRELLPLARRATPAAAPRGPPG